MLVLVVRTLILYGVVIIAMRIMGKRQLGELQPSELVVAIMISDLASVPMQTIDTPLLSGILPVLTLVVAEVMLSYLSLKSKRIRTFLSGEPSIIIYNGHINEKELARQRFNIDDLLEELRANNCHDVSDVEVAVIETSGKLSVIPKDRARAVTVEDMGLANVRRDGLPYNLIADGSVNKDELRRLGKSEKWLENEIKKHGINSVREVFIASFDAEGEMFLQRKGESDRK